MFNGSGGERRDLLSCRFIGRQIIKHFPFGMNRCSASRYVVYYLCNNGKNMDIINYHQDIASSSSSSSSVVASSFSVIINTFNLRWRSRYLLLLTMTCGFDFANLNSANLSLFYYYTDVGKINISN